MVGFAFPLLPVLLIFLLLLFGFTFLEILLLLSACTFEVVDTPAVDAWALARLALASITLLGVAFYLEMSFLAAVAATLVFFHHVDTERLVLYCDTLNHAHVFGDELKKIGIPGLSIFVNHFCKLILDVLMSSVERPHQNEQDPVFS